MIRYVALCTALLAVPALAEELPEVAKPAPSLRLPPYTGLRNLAVSIDTEVDGPQKMEELIAANERTFPVLKALFDIVARRWLGTKSPLPSVFMVRPDGMTASVHRGCSQDGAELLTREVEAALESAQ
jgi:hypothetical protein